MYHRYIPLKEISRTTMYCQSDKNAFHDNRENYGQITTYVQYLLLDAIIF